MQSSHGYVNYYYDAAVENAKSVTFQFSSRMQPGPVKTYVIALLLLFIAMFAIPASMLATTMVPQNSQF
ncbi:MAG: hypothetical protein R2741_01260 [Methanolobus sp.]